MMGITGPDAQTPIKVGPGVGDLIPGLFAVIGIVMAVMNARQSGAGQFVDVSMVDCVLATTERIINQYSYTGRVPRPEGNRHPLLCPYGVVRAADGWLTLSAPTDAFWRRLLTLIERSDLEDDLRYAATAQRLQRQDEVYAIVEAFTRTRTKTELAALFGGVIPFGPIYDVADIFADPHFRIRGMLVDVEQPGSATPVKVAGVPIKMSRTPGGVRRRAPLLGEHTREILELAGYASTAADSLFRRHIVK
jgi:crotonobetainyl-CoA:carnitine CoA-transferase CaiB-like acyl-CoA transferase